MIETPSTYPEALPVEGANGSGPESGTPTVSAPQQAAGSNRILVVEEQVSASNLFVQEGYEVEKRSHGELTGTGAQDVNGRIKQSEFAAIWLTLPPGNMTLPPQKCSNVLRTRACWFRTAAMIGTVAVLTAPKSHMWTNEHISDLLRDNVALLQV